MNWWIWAVAGLALVVIELSGPGFFFIFLAVGAFASSVMAYFWPTSPLWEQVLTFSVVSILSLVFFRKPLMQRFGLDKTVSSREEIVEEEAIPVEDIPPGGAGKAELRGTFWNARNGSSTTLAKGQRCRVKRVDGLTLWLKPE